MPTEQLFRERGKEAREKAAATTNELTRLVWLEIAKGFERLAESVGPSASQLTAHAAQLAARVVHEVQPREANRVIAADGILTDLLLPHLLATVDRRAVDHEAEDQNQLVHGHLSTGGTKLPDYWFIRLLITTEPASSFMPMPS